MKHHNDIEKDDFERRQLLSAATTMPGTFSKLDASGAGGETNLDVLSAKVSGRHKMPLSQVRIKYIPDRTDIQQLAITDIVDHLFRTSLSGSRKRNEDCGWVRTPGFREKYQITNQDIDELNAAIHTYTVTTARLAVDPYEKFPHLENTDIESQKKALEAIHAVVGQYSEQAQIEMFAILEKIPVLIKNKQEQIRKHIDRRLLKDEINEKGIAHKRNYDESLLINFIAGNESSRER